MGKDKSSLTAGYCGRKPTSPETTVTAKLGYPYAYCEILYIHIKGVLHPLLFMYSSFSTTHTDNASFSTIFLGIYAPLSIPLLQQQASGLSTGGNCVSIRSGILRYHSFDIHMILYNEQYTTTWPPNL